MDGRQLRRVLTRLERGNLHPKVWTESYVGAHYRVSTEGTVWSNLQSGKVLSPTYHSGMGYKTVFLTVNEGSKKTMKVDQVVLRSFVPRAHQAGWVAQHIDQDRSNNRFTNLRWANKRVSLAGRRSSRPKVTRGSSIPLIHFVGTKKSQIVRYPSIKSAASTL